MQFIGWDDAMHRRHHVFTGHDFFENQGIRIQSAHALGRIGVAARATVPALWKSLHERTIDRLTVLNALWEIDPQPESIVAELTAALEETAEPDEPIFAQLARLGPGAKAAVPALRFLLERNETAQKDLPLTIFATEVLGRIGPGARDAIPELERLSQSEDAELRGAAVMALWRIDGRTKQPVQTLRALLREQPPAPPSSGKKEPPSPWVRARAARALGRIGPAAQEALPTLRAVSREKEMLPRLAAAEALWRVEGNPTAALPVLRAALRDRDAEARRVAAEMLSVMGPSAKPAIPDLQESQKDAEPAVRHAAADALTSIQKEK